MSLDPQVAPHWGSAALVTIDMQRDFLTEGAFGVPGTTEILPKLGALIDAFRVAGRPIVHIVRLYHGSDAERVRRTLIENGADFVRPGTPGRLLADPITAVELDDERLLKGEPQPLGPNEWALYKPRWGAFYRTRLDELLAEHSIDTLVFGGCNLPNCPRASIIEAHERDFRVVLATDAVSHPGTPAGYPGFQEVAGLGTVLMSTDEIAAALRA
jgi:nicotinamidase-related amidase